MRLFRDIPKWMLAILLLWLMPQMLAAQQRQRFSVASFEADPFDQTAREGQYTEKDDNGALYAIIKVTSNNPDDNLNAFQFNFGNLYHKTVVHDDELWVYVQQNAKWVTIEREGYTPVRRYTLSSGIEAGRVYVMQLSVTAAPVVKQMVQFRVKPVGVTAMVMVKSTQEGAVEEVFGNTDASGAVAKSLRLGTYNYRIVASDYYEANGQFTLNDRTKTQEETVTLRPRFAEVTLQVDADADIYVDGELYGQRKWSGRLAHGNYTVECRQEHHRSASQYIKVDEEGDHVFQLTPPTPITGSLSVVSHPLGATISVDDNVYGQTPRIIDNLIIGQHRLDLTLNKYRPFTQEVEIRENETAEVEMDLVLLTGKEPKVKKVKAEKKKEEKPKVEKKAEIADTKVKEPKPSKAEDPESDYQKATCGYLSADMQLNFNPSIGVGLTAGTYIHGFNIEANFLFGLSHSEDIYWDAYGPFNYKPLSFGARLGYGFSVGKQRLRLTPQVGVQLVPIKASADGETSKSHAIPLSIGLRADYAFARHFGVYLAPEYDIAVKKADIYSQLIDVSSTGKIKSWGTGFNVRIGFRYSF